MSIRQRSPYVHKHIHYHYHYDVNEKYESEPLEKLSSKSTVTPQQSHIFNEKVSWKNHINPEISKLYEEISLNQSDQQTFTPKASRFSNHQNRQWSHAPVQNDSLQISPSRLKLYQDLQKHYQYLQKKRLYPNIFVPKSANFIRFINKNSDNTERQTFTSLKELNENNENGTKDFNDINFKTTQSNIQSFKQCQSTTARQQNQILRYSDLRLNLEAKEKERQRAQSNLVGYSEIKAPNTHFIVDKAKNRMSHIEGETHKYEQQNSNFSLFQKQGRKQSQKGSSQENRESIKLQEQINHPEANLNQEQINHAQSNQNQEKNNQLFESKYSYDLMRDECEFLRNKFIQHIEKTHNLKF